jgi:integrase
MIDPKQIPYVQRAAKGQRLYFRKGDFRCRLYSPDGSDDLKREIEAIQARLADVERATRPTTNTIGEALDLYAASADFLSNSPSTQADYNRRRAEIKIDAGDVLLSEVDAEFVTSLTSHWWARGHRVAALNLQVLRNACMPAVLDGRIVADPFSSQKKVRRPHNSGEPNPAWRDDEVRALIAEAVARKQPGLARAIALGRYAGFRRSTICTVPLAARIIMDDEHGRRRWIYWLTKKRQVLADKPEDLRLTQLLGETPDAAATIAYNADGRPFNARGLNQALDRLIDRLAEKGQVRPNLTLHGLRHARGVELANAGASDAEIMSQLEHLSTRAAQIYRRQAHRRVLAESAQSKIDQTFSKQSHQRSRRAR